MMFDQPYPGSERAGQRRAGWRGERGCSRVPIEPAVIGRLRPPMRLF